MMATPEDRITNLEEKYSNLHTVVSVLANKVDNLVDELKDFKQEMRQQNEMRANEISEMRQAFQSLQNQNIVVIIGVIAIAVAVFLK